MEGELGHLSVAELEARLATAITAGKRAARASRFARYKPLPYQTEWYTAPEPIKALVLPNQSGKCLAPDAPVTLGNGDVVPARELVGREFEVATLEGARGARAEWNRLEPTYRLTTHRHGLEIERNAEHPIWCADVIRRNGKTPEITWTGWRAVAAITPGTLVAVSEVPVFGENELPDEQIELLAMLIGDGSIYDNVTFTQSDGALADRFLECVAAMGLEAKLQKQQNRSPSYRVVAGGKRDATTGRFLYGTNPAMELLRDCGLYGHRSATKFVPRVVQRASRRQVALFLNRLFACDGWACLTTTGSPEIGYASISKRLASDVRDLLIRLGIRPRFRERAVAAQGPDYRVYSLEIHEVRFVERFAAEVGILGKESALERARAAARSRLGRKERRWLERGAPDGCFWDIVRSVERAGMARTVALEVPGLEMFVTPVLEHNTTAGAIQTISSCLGGYPPALSGDEAPRVWPRGVLAGKRFLAAGASFKTITERTILPKLKEYLADDMISGSKSTQGFQTIFNFVTGATLILMSYEQKVKDFEGGNWDGAWFDEPPPKEIFYAVRRGQMATSGWAWITATPLSEPWMLDDLIIPAQSLDCRECSGGEVAHVEILKAQPNHGLVYVPEPIEMHDNCAQCHGGYLPHAEIESYLASITDEAQRRARQFGVFLNYSNLEFGYVNDQHIVEDFQPPPSWPLVEVVDPAAKRGLHIKWYTCDDKDRWVNTHAARIPSDGGFRKMAQEVLRWRQIVGHQPDLALMDPRGGHHQHITAEGREDWFTGFRREGLVYTPAIAGYENSGIEKLHDWLRPAMDPSKADEPVPRLRFCRRLKTMPKGPLWAYERFVWNPMDSTRKKYEQPAKDFVDCDIYLAIWIDKHELTFRKFELMDRPRRTSSLAASYESGDPGRRSQRIRTRTPWERRPGLGRSYPNGQPEWVSRIKGYS